MIIPLYLKPLRGIKSPRISDSISQIISASVIEKC